MPRGSSIVSRSRPRGSESHCRRQHIGSLVVARVMVASTGRACLAHRVRMVSDLQDAALMTSALWGLSVDDLRSACRARPDITACRISWTINGVKRNSPKPRLVAMLVQSLVASPVSVATRTEQQRQMRTKSAGLTAGIRRRTQFAGLTTGIRKAEKTKKVGLPTRVMFALLRSLGPLWQEMVQWDCEFLEGNYGSFHGHDGLFMLAAQLKHPALVKLFLESLASQGFPLNPPEQIMVSIALRHVASQCQVNHAESDNLDSQGVSRFFGFVALARFGIIQVSPDGPLDLGKTHRRYSIVEEPRGSGSSVVDKYLSLDFGLLPHMTLLQATGKVKAKLQDLPASQLMGGNYICPWLVRAYVSARGIDRCTQAMSVRQYLECFPDQSSWLETLAVDLDERVADLCLRLDYGGRACHLSATTCLLNDQRVLHLLPADGDLAEQMRMRLPELLVARDAYVSIHGFSPSPYTLFSQTFEQSLPPEALRAAAERRAARLAETQKVTIQESIQCYAHDVVVSRIAVLGMSAAARVKLSFAESFTLLARASSFVPLSSNCEWTLDVAAHIAFLLLSARFEWSLECAGRWSASSPESAVSVDRWGAVMLDITQVPINLVRIAEVRIINSLGSDLRSASRGSLVAKATRAS